MPKNNVAVKVEYLSKSFRIPLEASNGIKQKVINLFKGVKGYRVFTPLNNISFEVEKGDFFGIVGRNGSGKSTLLKTIAGIYTPEEGSVTANGSLVPFIELGVGFNPELTGRENVYLNGALLGFSHKEMDTMYDDIVSFAELEEFMDEKLKNYSSGMQVRLAFSIAIRAQGDILVLDEVLAVGDEAFQRKCNDYFASIKNSKKTVILVTHDMESVRKYCNKAMMISNGKIITIGSPDDVANEYSLENLDSASKNSDNKDEKNSAFKFKVKMLSSTQITQNDKVAVEYSVTAPRDIEAGISADLYSVDDGYYVYCAGSPLQKLVAGKAARFKLEFDISMLNDANMIIRSSVRDNKGNLLTFSDEKNSPHFMIRRIVHKGTEKQFGAIFKDGKNVKWQ